MVLKDIVFRVALENAVKYKGKANPKALIGGVVKENPDAKSDMELLRGLIEEVVSEVNSMSIEEQQAKLLALDPDFEDKQAAKKQARKEQASSLPELENAKHGEVVTRIPPEPSKYAHIGHAMSFLINYLYAKHYGGKCILRFDDTNPEKESEEFVTAMEEDIREYLGIEVDRVMFASEDMDTFYEYADKLIADGNAYVSEDTSEMIAAQRRALEPSPGRERSTEDNKKLWEEMKKGIVDEGKYTLRLKIDYAHKNAVMRDPVIYRSCYTEHYKQEREYNVWPMYDFETAIEEGLTGVTHVLRSNEFDQRIELHNYIASLFDFPPVTYRHYGRYNVTGATTQGREIRALIESGEYIGWDDPRLVTLKALKRRGIVKEAFYELAKQIGLSKTQTNLDFSVIAKVNRTLLDQSAKRFFGVTKPVLITVNNIPADVPYFNLAYHPHDKKGERKLACVAEYFIEEKDHAAVQDGGVVRLIDGMNIRKVTDTTYEFVSLELDKSLNASLIHYVPKDGNEVKATVLLPDVTQQGMICERNVVEIKEGDVVQFERYGFCRLDKIEGDKLSFWFTHE